MKQTEYTVKIITDGPQHSDALASAILHMGGYDILSVEVTNFRVVPVKREKTKA